MRCLIGHALSGYAIFGQTLFGISWSAHCDPGACVPSCTFILLFLPVPRIDLWNSRLSKIKTIFDLIYFDWFFISSCFALDRSFIVVYLATFQSLLCVHERDPSPTRLQPAHPHLYVYGNIHIHICNRHIYILSSEVHMGIGRAAAALRFWPTNPTRHVQNCGSFCFPYQRPIFMIPLMDFLKLKIVISSKSLIYWGRCRCWPSM